MYDSGVVLSTLHRDGALHDMRVKAHPRLALEAVGVALVELSQGGMATRTGLEVLVKPCGLAHRRERR